MNLDNVMGLGIGTVIVIVLALLLVFYVYPWWEKKRDERWIARNRRIRPVLYRCENNGVLAFVFAYDYNEAYAEYWKKVESRQIEGPGGLEIMYVIPRTMIFCSDEHFYPCRLTDQRTGNLEEYKQLIEGCLVEHRTFFVPFSTFVYDEAWQRQTFRRVSLDEAFQSVHKIQGRKAA